MENTKRELSMEYTFKQEKLISRILSKVRDGNITQSAIRICLSSLSDITEDLNYFHNHQVELNTFKERMDNVFETIFDYLENMK